MLLVSACLLGVECKYNGLTNAHQQIQELAKRGGVIPFCPEQLGGLSTPRPPVEICGGDGRKVLGREATVLSSRGEDVTEAFLKGARESLKIARLFHSPAALLKEGSPSCGSSSIYDGTFTHTKRKGQGVTAALLEREGVVIFSEEEWERMEEFLSLPLLSCREKKYIGVIGAAKANQEIYRLAYETGELIAQNQAILLCGGRGGVMEAAAKGARDRGGLAIGLLPGSKKEEGSPFLSVSLATGLGDARNAIITRAADALIAIGGAYGTLSEIGLALKMGKKVVGLKTWRAIDYEGVEGEIERASTPKEAISLLFSSLERL